MRGFLTSFLKTKETRSSSFHYALFLMTQEKVWSESHLAVASGTITEDKTEDEKPYSPQERLQKRPRYDVHPRFLLISIVANSKRTLEPTLVFLNIHKV